MTVTATPTGLTLYSPLISVKASCLYLYLRLDSAVPALVPRLAAVVLTWLRASAPAGVVVPADAVVAADAAVRLAAAAAVDELPAGAAVAPADEAVRLAAAAAVAEPPEAAPALPAFPVVYAATQYAVTLALLYAVPTRCAVAA